MEDKRGREEERIDYSVEIMNERKKELLHIISNINNAGTIEYLHTFIKLFTERWG